MTCAYGLLDAGKIVYATVSEDKSVRHRVYEKAGGLYAKRQMRSLDERDERDLCAELGVSLREDQQSCEGEVSWYTMFDWIEDND